VSGDFLLLVFHESVSPQHHCIPLGPFQIFSKTRGDILKSRCTTAVYQRHWRQNFATSFASVVDTGGKFATSVNNTSGKFAAGVNDTVGNLPPVSTTPAANLGKISGLSGPVPANFSF
jgi:hypothetical protein